MKVILVVMLELGVLYFFAPGGYWQQERVAAEDARTAENELWDAQMALKQATAQSAGYEVAHMRFKKAAIRTYLAEAEYKRCLNISIFSF